MLSKELQINLKDIYEYTARKEIADEGILNPPIVTVRGFSTTGEYQWEEVYNRTPIEAIDANYLNINDVYWWHVIHYHKEDRYTLAPTMMKLEGRLKVGLMRHIALCLKWDLESLEENKTSYL